VSDKAGTILDYILTLPFVSIGKLLCLVKMLTMIKQQTKDKVVLISVSVLYMLLMLERGALTALITEFHLDAGHPRSHLPKE
jgi:hypothetical protein